jgi:hypothetical protein
MVQEVSFFSSEVDFVNRSGPGTRAQTSKLCVRINHFIVGKRRNTGTQADFLELLHNLSDSIAAARAVECIKVHISWLIWLSFVVHKFDAVARAFQFVMLGLAWALILGSLERLVNRLFLQKDGRNSSDRETLAVAEELVGSVDHVSSVVVMTALLLAAALADEKSIVFQNLLLLLVIEHSLAGASADEGSFFVIMAASLLVGIQVNASARALESDIVVRRRRRR